MRVLRKQRGVGRHRTSDPPSPCGLRRASPGLGTRDPGLRTPRREARLHIAAAIIRRRDGRILITQRPPESALAGLWEFPGGKRKPGETLAACCAREIREELGIGIDVGRRVARIDHDYPHARVTLQFFACRSRGGRPRRIGCSAWRWVRPEDLGRFKFPQANGPIVDRLVGKAGGRRQ